MSHLLELFLEQWYQVIEQQSTWVASTGIVPLNMAEVTSFKLQLYLLHAPTTVHKYQILFTNFVS